MTTFGLPAVSDSFDAQSYENLPMGDTSHQVPNILVQDDDSRFLSSDPHLDSPPPGDSDSQNMEEPPITTAESDLDYPLIATQPQTQSQQIAYIPVMDQHLVGCLIPATARCAPLDLWKSKENGEWTIGRHETNDLVLKGMRLSNFHCRLTWNGELGKQSEVKLEDRSTNGTWVNNMYVKKGQQSILRGGAAICLGGAPDVPNNVYRYIFRDIEGQSTRHANQIWAKYDIGNELGAGAFARVYKCIERATGIEYAVKIIDKSKLHRSHMDEQAIIREISILQRLADFRHKNIVALHEHFEEKDAIYLILELVRGGDLLSYITMHGPLPEDQVRRMAAQICHAVAYVHSHGITHRDLKPENVMMTATNPPDCKVADFGLAKLVNNQTFLKTMCGTPAYLAPEVMLRADAKQAYDCRVDTWSLGIIFYCMLTNSAPFHEAFDPEADAAVQRLYFGTRKVDWELLNIIHLSEDGLDFLRNMLIEDPRNRKTVAYMLDHHWISHLVPPDSQFQRAPPPASPLLSESSATPPTTDGAIACSQSMENLNLSDLSIPGLSMIDQDGAKKKKAAGVSSDPVRQGSFASEVSVTAKIPGAFPKSKKDKALATVEEAVEEAAREGTPRKFVAPPSIKPKAPGPSREIQSPETQSVKRKSDLIAGSSPLSSLSSSEGEEEGETVRPASKKAIAARRGVTSRTRTKVRAVEAPGNKRKGRPPSSMSRLRRGAPKDEEEHIPRKSSRPPAKTPRYT